MQVWNSIKRGSGALSSVFVFLMIVTIVPDVLLRHFANKPIKGVLELNTVFMVVVVFMGLAWTESENYHVNVNIINNLLNPFWNCLLKIFSYIVSLILFLFILAASINATYVSLANNEMIYGFWEFPVWPVKSIIVIGIFLLCIEFIVKLNSEIRKLLVKRIDK